MVSGVWGLCEFVLSERGYLFHWPDFGVGDDVSLPILGAWEPATNRAARTACILATYAREWHGRAMPPFMGQWANGQPELLRDALRIVLEEDPMRWEMVLDRLRTAPEPPRSVAETLREVIALSSVSMSSAQAIIHGIAVHDDALSERLVAGTASAKEASVVLALYVHCLRFDARA